MKHGEWSVLNPVSLFHDTRWYPPSYELVYNPQLVRYDPLVKPRILDIYTNLAIINHKSAINPIQPTFSYGFGFPHQLGHHLVQNSIFHVFFSATHRWESKWRPSSLMMAIGTLRMLG